MSNAKHTPGPWHASEPPEPLTIQDRTGREIASLSDEELVPETEANACLIASAPELLELLEQVSKAWHSIPEDTQVPDELNSDIFWDMVRDAIARAKGGAA